MKKKKAHELASKITSRYATKIINDNIIETLKFGTKNDIAPMTYLTDEERAAGKPGYILAPYIMELTEPDAEPSKEYKEFMDAYRIKHEVCPNCGQKAHMTTLIGFIFNSSKPEEYKDLNNCTCVNCHDVHTYHERISIKEYEQR